MKPVLNPRSWRGIVIATMLLAGTLGARPADAQYLHSYILIDTPFSTNPEIAPSPVNTIFTYDAATELATVVTPDSHRLTQMMLNGQVDALSYGTDVGEEGANHTYFFWSIARHPTGRTMGLPKTPLAMEPPDESEADIFIVGDRPTQSRAPGPHLKIIDENNGSPGSAGIPHDIEFAEHLGLTGIAGRPQGTPPDVSNVGAFTYNPVTHARTNNIYFSVAPGTPGYHPADILRLMGGTITVYKPHHELDLGPGDDIDGLALDVTQTFGPAEIGWYSLSPESPSLLDSMMQPIYSAADLFRFESHIDYTSLQPQLYMTAESMGIRSHVVFANDGNIDSIGHIDPISSRCPLDVSFAGMVDINCNGALDLGFYTLVVGGKPFLTARGTQRSVSLPAFSPGDHEVVSVFGMRDGIPFHGTRIVEMPSMVAPVSDLDATVVGSTVTWTWTLPTGGYTDMTVRLNCDPTLTISTTTMLTTSGLLPGHYTLEVHGRSGTDASPAAFATAFVPPPALPLMPDNVTASTVGTSIELAWENPAPGATSVDVTLDGVVVATVSGAAGPASTVIPAMYGWHKVTLRSEDGSGSSLAAAIEVIVPLPDVGAELQAASSPVSSPVDVAIAGSTVYVASSTSGSAALVSTMDVSSVSGTISMPTPTGIGVDDEVQGLASDGSLLYWIIEGQLVTSFLDGSGASLPVQLPGLVDPAGASIDGNGTLWVCDLASDSLKSYSTTGTSLGSRRPDEGGALSPGIATRTGVVDMIQADVTGAQSVVSLNDAALRVGTTPLPAGDVTAVAFVTSGSAGIASYYAIDSDANEIVEIVALDPLLSSSDVSCHDSTVVALEIEATGGPWAIPDDGTPLEVPVVVASGGRFVSDIEVFLDMEHSFVGDVAVELESPTGTIVPLLLPGHEGRYVRRFIDDLASNGFDDTNGTRPTDGPETLGEFDGESADGTWTLRATDDVLLETGSIEAWRLRVCVDAVPSDPFQRGDCNGDSAQNIADAVQLLSHLFVLGTPTPPCFDACDANDDGTINIADAVCTLSVLFLANAGGNCQVFAEPNDTCGADASIDALSCDPSFSCP